MKFQFIGIDFTLVNVSDPNVLEEFSEALSM